MKRVTNMIFIYLYIYILHLSEVYKQCKKSLPDNIHILFVRKRPGERVGME